MSDNHQRYRSIRMALSQMYATEPKGLDVKHLNVLACLISGIVGSHSTNYPKIASKVPDRTLLPDKLRISMRKINERDRDRQIGIQEIFKNAKSQLKEAQITAVSSMNNLVKFLFKGPKSEIHNPEISQTSGEGRKDGFYANGWKPLLF